MALAVYAGAYALTVQLNWDPEPVRLALVLGLTLALVELVLSAFEPSWQSWRVDSLGPVGQPGRDAQFSTYLRILEGHLTAKHPDAAFRERLAALADRRLMQTHGVRRDDERAAALLGSALLRDLDGPPRRMSIGEIEQHLTRIEEL